MRRSSVLVVVALLLAGLSLWFFARLLAAGATPLYHLLPGIGLALAFVLARAGIEARESQSGRRPQAQTPPRSRRR